MIPLCLYCYSSSGPIPEGWAYYQHPNGDIYFHNPELRYSVSEDITDPEMLEWVLEARDDHIDTISDDPNYDRLPPDWELTATGVTETDAIMGIYSRSAGQAYGWKEDGGAGRLVILPRHQFWAYVSEYPCHTGELPPGVENEFLVSIEQGKGIATVCVD